MNRQKSRSRQRTSIAVEPLLRAFFDIPQTIPIPTQIQLQNQIPVIGQYAKGNNRLALHSRQASSNSSKHSSPLSKNTPEDDGVASDNSILLGESISLTSDADFYDSGYNSPPGTRSLAPLIQENVKRDNNYVQPCDGNLVLPSAGLKVETIFEGDDEIMSQQSKKKKKKSSAFKSLKKLVGSKISGKSKLSGASKKSLAASSSFSEDDTVTSNIYSGESLSNEVQRLEDSLPSLQTKITKIRSNIQSLERTLLATRNDLARAHEQLHLATLELEDLQRAALEADIGFSNLCHRRSRSIRSTSSEHLHFLTPNSSLIDGDDSELCYTPRSTASFESLSSQNDRDINQPILSETKSGRVDVDATPLTKNSHSKRSKYRNVDNISPLAYDSSDTPSTTASTMESSDGFDKLSTADEACLESKKNRVKFHTQESFIRTHDLGLVYDGGPDLLLSLHDHDLGPVIDALFQRGLQSAMDESDSWTPVRDTEKILSKRAKDNGEVEGPKGSWPNAASGSDVFVWSAPCKHEGHGSEYPLVKARGLIPTSALKVVELLLDSESVKRYNKMSLGRIDECCFSQGVDKHERCPNTGIQGEAKIVRSKSQPPIIRKQVELRILLHARRLHAEGETPKYITIGRSVWETEEGKAKESDTSATRCEMLLSANLVREIEYDGQIWCEVTTITHAASPGGIPYAIGKRVALAAAANYIRDIRAVFE